ncbi:MAG: 23S rRNA (pseudouridine(1915)-N(3))-methyltransferase RlmH [Pseudomonadales bacterium]|jgi:23S rRNA (pseudouridine1915-N3)-methyltransferase|nr:23S rRNA (pseudouridine(1915)-N(3))-methyltransferase RlmH [Pseudomonadales bacterium]
MKLKILAVGAKAPKWVQAGFEAFAKRMPTSLKIELVEISPSKHARDPHRFISQEGVRILAKVKDQDWVVALDERGKAYNSEDLAQRIEAWQMQGSDVVFTIGGSDGLADDVKERANEMMALSALTLPHHLVKVLLAETLYRAWTISTGHPYHRA